MDIKCSILVTSCDNYEDAWHPFFSLFSKMWCDCKYPIYLNTETKDYSHENLSIKCLHPAVLTDKKGKSISWSNRLKQALMQIDTEYVLFLLEDFFLMSTVRADIVENCIAIMEQNKSISAFDFHSEPHEDAVAYGEFSQVSYDYDYSINAMAALWRKSFLLDIIRDDESPWEFELNGTYRFRRTNNKIYSHREEFAPVFDYKIKPKYGYGIYQGKWLWKNKELFEDNGITADFSKRETLQYDELPDLEGRVREKDWIINDIKKVMVEPKLFFHYTKCFSNIMKDKLRRLNVVLFHR